MRRAMAFYKVLLADDEEEIREGMIRKIDWNRFGFEIAAFAENGMEALELVEQTSPDVIITDIRMPFLDGLEFVEKAVNLVPSVKIIIFSGFDDFEYAQRAIKLNVEEYLLKPISASQLEESLIRLKKKMDADMEQRRDIELLQKNYEETLPIMKEQFLLSWIQGTLSADSIDLNARKYGITLCGKRRLAIVIHADQEPILEEESKESEFYGREELIPIVLKQMVDTILGKSRKIQSFIYVDMVVAIVEMEWESQVSQIVNEVNEICRMGKNIVGLDIAAGIGNSYEEAEELSHSYEEAVNALEYSVLLSKDGAQVTYIKDIEPDHSITVEFGEAKERALSNAIKLGDGGIIQEKMEGFFAELEGLHLPFYQYQIYILEVWTAVLKIVGVYQLNSEKIFGEGWNYVAEVLKNHSLDQIKKWLIQSCIKISDQIQQQRMNSGKLLADQARQFVEEHYADASLSVDSICKMLHLSSAYFSTLFKKEMKISFVSFLTDVRLKHAVELLDTTTDKTYIIAGKVGYTESNYFSYVFKKKYGVSPSRYRKHWKENQ